MNKFFAWFLLITLITTGCAAPSVDKELVIPTNIETESPIETEAPIMTETPVAIDSTDIPEITTIPILTDAPVVPERVTSIEEVIASEMRSSFDFFWEQANTDTDSAGYGLIRDRYPGSEGVASIASVGFGLTAYPIGIEKGYISYQEGYDRANGTLDTLLNMDREQGFFYHFVNMTNGKRAWNSEVSNIDTSILLMGVLTAGEYFGGEIERKAKQLYDGVNWPWFVDESRNMFHMAYKPESGYEGHWDFYAEQLMMYILAAGSDTHPVDDATYYGFTRHYAKYGDGKPFIHSWFGSIFTYQYSHAWIDFREYTDKEGVNWFDNSVEASLAHINFAKDVEGEYETIGTNAWGLTACDGPNGYNGLYGAPPSGFDNNQHLVDDTVPPSGAIGSIIFLPVDVKNAMLHYSSQERLNSRYGFIDAYNLTENWYATDVIGINKGITLLMLANYENGFVYEIMMKNENILKGLEVLQINNDQ